MGSMRLAGAFRWGTGLTFPSRNFLRVVGELNGYVPSSDVATTTTALTGVDLSRSPLTSNTENITRATLGLTLQTKKGLFFGRRRQLERADACAQRVVHRRARRPSATTTTCSSGSATTRGSRSSCRRHRRRRHRPPQAPIQAPVHNLSVRAACDPCTVEVGQVST